MLDVSIKLLHPEAKLPTKSDGNIGWDLSCVADEKFNTNTIFGNSPANKDNKKRLVLYPGERHIFHTGLSMAIPAGYAGFLWDRSGLAARNGLHRLAGVIDSNYRGEWLVCLINLSDTPQTITERDRIIQLIFQREIPAEFRVVESLDETDRGSNGFGSSGK